MEMHCSLGTSSTLDLLVRGDRLEPKLKIHQSSNPLKKAIYPKLQLSYCTILHCALVFVNDTVLLFLHAVIIIFAISSLLSPALILSSCVILYHQLNYILCSLSLSLSLSLFFLSYSPSLISLFYSLSFILSFSLILSLSYSFSLTVFLFVSLSLLLFLSLFLSLSLTLCLSLSSLLLSLPPFYLFISLSLSLFLYLSLTLCFYISHTLCLSLSPLFPSMYLSFFLFLYLSLPLFLSHTYVYSSFNRYARRAHAYSSHCGDRLIFEPQTGFQLVPGAFNRVGVKFSPNLAGSRYLCPVRYSSYHPPSFCSLLFSCPLLYQHL